MMNSKRPLRTEAICASVAVLFLLGLTICAVGQPTADKPEATGAGNEPADKPLATRPSMVPKSDKADKADKGTLDIKVDASGLIESYSVHDVDVRQSLRLLGFKYKRNIVVSPNVT
ncbi:MAG: hypothetical protein WCK05_11465, partial [Planctomycetota bacterium]